MSDDDLIRRGDARRVWGRWNWPRTEADRDIDVDAELRALPAASRPVEAAAVRLAEAYAALEDWLDDKDDVSGYGDRSDELREALSAYRAAKGDA